MVMSILEDYEKRFGLAPLTNDEILERVEIAEAGLGTAEHNPAQRTDRVIVWLHDQVQSLAGRLGMNKAPDAYRCGWCFRALGSKDEQWHELPLMSLDDVQTHSQLCEHNPLVQKIRKLESLLAEDGWIPGEAKS